MALYVGTCCSAGQIIIRVGSNKFIIVITFRTSSAENLPFEDSTVTLITAGRAIQYFDFEKFFAECQRVLVPGGVVAFYSSDHVKFIIDDEPEKASKLNELFRKVA